MKQIIIFLLLLQMQLFAQNTEERPHNVIFMIGDGMGISQITLTQFLHGKLALDQFPVTGLVTTHSANAWVTDSAAAATALATGVKTNNFFVGVDQNGKKLKTIIEQAKENHFATGLVTTSKITHATPASFGAHVNSRKKEKQIAKQYLNSNIDVLFGGGAKFFSKKLKSAFKKKKYFIATSLAQLNNAKGKTLGLFSHGHISYVLDRSNKDVDLAKMTQKAIEILSNRGKGFFLMVEGARIDMACHASNAASSVAEMRDFDAAIQVALNFAKKNKNTLVVVTADHATGGMAFSEKVQLRKSRFAKVTASSEAMVNEVLAGKSLKSVLKKRAGIKKITSAEQKLFNNTKSKFDKGAVIGEIVSKRLGVNFISFEYRKDKPNTTHGHDGAMVPVYSFGPGANKFTGTLDNTDIPKRIRKLLGW